MKIGIFTDTYLPSMNGIVYVTEILRRNLEALGHEVYIFAPAPNLNDKSDDPHIIRFPALAAGVPYDDFNASLFFPPKVVKQVEALNLDIIHFLTPGPVGLMAIYTAYKLGTPVIAEYCTDLFEYVEHYPKSLPVIFGLGAIMPFTFKASREELLEMIKTARPRRGIGEWKQEMIKHLLTTLHSHCQAVIVHSRKSQHQLGSWQDDETRHELSLIPTGVDSLPVPSPATLAAFKKRYGLHKQDEVILFAGRLSAEKNLDLLIDTIAELVKWRPHAKLVYVGDFPDYKPTLEAHAAASPAASRIVFTGKLLRQELGVAFAAANVFVFPSLTDTQGLVLHEAALAGLPLVMIDREVSEVMHDGENGFYAENDPISMAAKIRTILEDPELAARMGRASRTIAAQYSEKAQTERLAAVYASVLATYPHHPQV